MAKFKLASVLANNGYKGRYEKGKYKNGQRINITSIQHSNEREPRQLSNENSHQRIRITKIGRKHIFTINQIMSEHDEGTYTCHAVNEIGEAKHNFQVASELQKLFNLFINHQSFFNCHYSF